MLKECVHANLPLEKAFFDFKFYTITVDFQSMVACMSTQKKRDPTKITFTLNYRCQIIFFWWGTDVN